MPASPQIVGRYGIYGRIAAGGMASVHFGRLLGEAGFSRTVAVKRLHAHLAEDPQFLATMIDEARLAARIHHPNVVPTLDVVAAQGELLVIMEYVRGESLGRLIRVGNTHRRRLPLPIASAIAIGALQGLHAAHEAKSDRGAPLGIVHRDVSPQNILVGVDGVPRVIDFGVAKAAGRLQTTSNGALKGKVAYMAPEQLAAGDTRLAIGEVTRAADIYAMGVVLWEMLAGKRLFKGEHDAQLVLQVLIGAREAPSRYARDLPPSVDALVMKALALDPAARFATAKEMAEALQRMVQPAFSTELGAWVEDVAADALLRRGAELAEIESLSETVTVRRASIGRLHPASGGGGLAGARSDDDELTVASQPSSVALETPKSNPAVPAPRRSRAIVIGAIGGGLLLAAGGATFFVHDVIGGAAVVTAASVTTAGADAGVDPASTAPASTATRAANESADEPAAPVPPEETRPPVAPSAHPAAGEAARQGATSTAESAPFTRPQPPSKPRPKAHATPKTGPFRFAQPD